MTALHPQPRVVGLDHQKGTPSPMDLGDLWLRFQKELRAFVRPRVDSSETCDDLLQTAFIRAQQSVQEGTHPKEPRAWLFQIVRNLLIDTYRARERQKNALASLQKESAGADVAGDPSSAEVEAAEFIVQALPSFLSALSAPYRQALELTDIEGLGQAEAAKKAGVSLSCMKARVRRARLQLLEALKSCCTFQMDGRGRPIACAPRASDSSCACN